MTQKLTDFSKSELTTSQRLVESEILMNRCGILAAILCREKLSQEQRARYTAEAVITGYMLGQRLSAAEMTEALFGWVGESAASTGISASVLRTTLQDSIFNSQSFPEMDPREDSEASLTGSDEE